jgi:hypothetical protein
MAFIGSVPAQAPRAMRRLPTDVLTVECRNFASPSGSGVRHLLMQTPFHSWRLSNKLLSA